MEPNFLQGQTYNFKSVRVKKKNPLKSGHSQSFSSAEFRFHTGDVIALNPPGYKESSFISKLIQFPLTIFTLGMYTPKHQRKIIRRIIAVPGESVHIKNKEIFINHKKFSPEWEILFRDKRILPKYISERDNIKETFIPTERLFVLGDNWDICSDSRKYGIISTYSVKGILK